MSSIVNSESPEVISCGTASYKPTRWGKCTKNPLLLYLALPLRNVTSHMYRTVRSARIAHKVCSGVGPAAAHLIITCPLPHLHTLSQAPSDDMSASCGSANPMFRKMKTFDSFLHSPTTSTLAREYVGSGGKAS